jgi:hypothetical protein
LQPNVPPDANELKPNVADSGQTLPPPQQVNEIQAGSADTGATSTNAGADGKTTVSADQEKADEAMISSSKRKKKKGLKKLVPF